MQQENRTTGREEKDFMRVADLFNQWLQPPKVYVLNLEKEEKIYEVQRKMQEVLDEEDIETKVQIKPCPLGMGDVIIEFESDSFTVRNITKFQSIIKEMSNFEIYPTTQGIKFAGIITNVATVMMNKEDQNVI